MMKDKNFPLFLASVLSIFSFVCLMVALKLPQNTSKNVLGATSSNLVPCSVINGWQKQYCSSITPSIVPTNPPLPTPPTCYPNGVCLPSGQRCCNGYPATVRTTTCPSGKMCEEIKITPPPPTGTTPKPSPYPTRVPTITPTTAPPTPTSISNIPVIERAYPTIGQINQIICFYGRNFVGKIVYPITNQPKIEFYYQGNLLLSESLGQVNQHGKWEDRQVCTTITDPTFSGKEISVAIFNYLEDRGNYYYYFE